jgi:PAS domain S-box-containing protein
MNSTSFMGLIHNAALLLALVILFDLVIGKKRIENTRLWQAFLGLLLGLTGIALMMSPWVLLPGIIFDTRSVLLGISGLFFGAVPTIIAMFLTAVFRYAQGGTATWMGISVIVATGTIGIFWRRVLRKPLDALTGRELYLFGLVIHIVMLACAFVLPLETAQQVLASISLPVMLIYPVGTLLLGLLMVNRLRREHLADDLSRAEIRMRSLAAILQHPTDTAQEFLDFALEQIIQLTHSKIGYIYLYSETRQEFELNTWSKEVMEACNVQNPPSCYELQKTGIWGEAVRQRKPILLNDFQAQNPLKKGYPEGHVNLQKFLTVPIFCQGHIVAVAGVANKETDYDESDVLQLTLLMDGVWKSTTRKQVEEALRESEARYRRIVDTAQEGIWAMDAQQVTTFVNPHLAAMFGYDPNEMLGQTVQSFVFEEDRAAHLKYLQLRQQGQNSQHEQRYRCKDGGEIWAVVSGTAIQDVTGKFTGAFAMLTDITQRKRMESILQARLHLLQYAGDHDLGDLLQETLDTIGQLVNSPIGFYHFLDASEKNFSHQTWSRQTNKTFFKAEGRNTQQSVEQAGIWADCVRQRRPVIYNDAVALSQIKGIPTDSGVNRSLTVPIFRGSAIVAILGVGNKPTDYAENDIELVSTLADLAWDIAQQKLAQEKVTQSDEIARAILNAATEAVFLINSDGILIAVNETTAVRMGKSSSDLVGANINDVLPSDLAASRMMHLDLVVKERKSVHFEDQRADSWFENNIYPILDPDGQVTRVAIFDRDITDRKRAEANIQAAQTELQRLLIESDRSRRSLLSVLEDRKLAEDKILRLNLELEQRVQERTNQLEATNKELEAFAYSVSHDLRAPLRALDGFSEALILDYHEQLDEQGQHYLRRIQEATRRMGQLIEDLLNLSRITRREITFEQVNLSSLAQQIASELRMQTPERMIEFDIAPNLLVRADPNLIKIAMENLFSNALKFTGGREQAKIQVGVTEQSGERVFFVRDNGVGFNMAYAEKLFTPFQRLHSVQEFSGTGIGLVTVQRIITRHGGRIWPEAAVNQGATFYFTLETE